MATNGECNYRLNPEMPVRVPPVVHVPGDQDVLSTNQVILVIMSASERCVRYSYNLGLTV